MAFDYLRPRICYLLLTLLSWPFVVNGQFQSSTDAEAAGMAFAAASRVHVTAIFDNPGALGYVEENALATGLKTFYGFPGVFDTYLAASRPTNLGNFAVGVKRFGDDLFSHSNLSAAFGNTLGIASIGGAIHLSQVMAEGFRTRVFLTFDFGGMAKLGEEVVVAGVVKNISQTQWTDHSNEYVPTIFTTSLAYEPLDAHLAIRSQYDHTLSNGGTFRLGVEYQIQKLIIRAGTFTNPFGYTYGLSLRISTFHFSYAIITHQYLGPSHALSLMFTKEGIVAP